MNVVGGVRKTRRFEIIGFNYECGDSNELYIELNSDSEDGMRFL